tara:strand:+ start:127 stop:621 length:495 start_codon:yes stop_codon:yes gene_type:complete
MKKDKKIRELDEWLSNANDHDFDGNTTEPLKNYEEVQLEADFSYISEIDNTLGDFAYKKNGVQDYILNKLKKKNISEIDLGIDLHGETIKDSIYKLNDFFSYAYNNNVEFIKIICGKGNNSVDKIPRIKITTQSFIKCSNIVHAACTANTKDGGIGVLKVKLKK